MLKEEIEKRAAKCRELGITEEELNQAVASTSWSIETECGTDADEDGEYKWCRADITGSFTFRPDEEKDIEGIVEFKADEPDFEFEVTEGVGNGDCEAPEEVVEALCQFLTSVFYDKMEKQAEDAKQDAAYEARDAAEYARDPMRYHGVSWRDFMP